MRAESPRSRESAASYDQRVRATSALTVEIGVVRDEIAARSLAAWQAVKEEPVPAGRDARYTEGQRGRPVAAVAPRLRRGGVRATETAEEVEGRPGRAPLVDRISGDMAHCNEVDPHAEVEARAVAAAAAPDRHPVARAHMRLPHRHPVVGQRDRRCDEGYACNRNDPSDDHTPDTAGNATEVPERTARRPDHLSSVDQ
jgi:hypothetical protein